MLRVIYAMCMIWMCFSQDLFLSVGQQSNEPSESDLRRARKAFPGEAYLGSEPGHIASRLNEHLTKLANTKVKACLSHSLSELRDILARFWNRNQSICPSNIRSKMAAALRTRMWKDS